MVSLRFRPEWFKAWSLLGYGIDWPLSYAEMAPYYDEAKRALAVSGPVSYPWGPRRRRYPYREHQLNAPGLLLVKGPNVMSGYLNDAVLTASVIKDGYYVTGDIAKIDEDGFVTLTDRLSRFSKVAGEMVPHIKVEESLHEALGVLDMTFIVASVPDDKRGERLVVLYKGDLEIEPLLAKLAATGLPKLWIPDKSNFHKVAEFPLLGSGKVDMQMLKAEARRLEGL